MNALRKHEHWLAALEQLAVEHGLLEGEEFDRHAGECRGSTSLFGIARTWSSTGGIGWATCSGWPPTRRAEGGRGQPAERQCRIGAVAELEKIVWTDADFEVMGWHDASIHGIGFVQGNQPWLGDLMLDIDYIVEWAAPDASSQFFTFRVAPATLVFEEATEIDLRLSAQSVTFGVALQILALHRSPARRESMAATHHDYRIEGVNFELVLTAAGYRQHFRSRPLASQNQMLSTAERGLPSFSTEFIR